MASARFEVPKLFLEPFAGGAIASLTAVMERLTERCLMAELDHEVAALRHGPALCGRVQGFVATGENIQALVSSHPVDIVG